MGREIENDYAEKKDGESDLPEEKLGFSDVVNAHDWGLLKNRQDSASQEKLPGLEIFDPETEKVNKPSAEKHGPSMVKADFDKALDDKDNDLLFWGDNHELDEGKDAFKDSLDELKNRGVTHIGMEGFPDTEDVRDLINKYFHSSDQMEINAARAALEKILNETKGPSPEASAEDNEKAAKFVKDIMKIVDAIKKAGLEMVPLEPPGFDQRPPKTDEKERNAGKRSDSWNEAINRTLNDDSDDYRNKDGTRKMVIFAGGGHFDLKGPAFNSSRPGKVIFTMPGESAPA